jgi:hypothetical protein
LHDRVVYHDRLAEARAAVDDPVGDGRDAVRDCIERVDRRRGAVGLDYCELQARRAGVDD